MNSQINYEERIVAFIDILGFKSIIKESEVDLRKLETINKALKYLKYHEANSQWGHELMEIEEDAQKKGLNNFKIMDSVCCSCFSDSIVVSIRVKQNMISDKLLKKINYPLETKSERYPYHQYVSRFQDGCVGFHQIIIFQVLQNSSEMSNESLIIDLKKVKRVILNGLDSSFEYPEVFQKYLWLKEEYNKLIIHNSALKERFYELNENIAGNNIHFSYTDSCYFD